MLAANSSNKKTVITKSKKQDEPMIENVPSKKTPAGKMKKQLVADTPTTVKQRGRPKKAVEVEEESESEEEEPVTEKSLSRKNLSTKNKKQAKKAVEVEEEEEPVIKKSIIKKTPAPKNKKQTKRAVEDESECEEEEPETVIGKSIIKKTPATKNKKQLVDAAESPASVKKAGRPKKQVEEEDDEEDGMDFEESSPQTSTSAKVKDQMKEGNEGVLESKSNKRPAEDPEDTPQSKKSKREGFIKDKVSTDLPDEDNNEEVESPDDEEEKPVKKVKAPLMKTPVSTPEVGGRSKRVIKVTAKMAEAKEMEAMLKGNLTFNARTTSVTPSTTVNNKKLTAATKVTIPTPQRKITKLESNSTPTPTPTAKLPEKNESIVKSKSWKINPLLEKQKKVVESKMADEDLQEKELEDEELDEDLEEDDQEMEDDQDLEDEDLEEEEEEEEMVVPPTKPIIESPRKSIVKAKTVIETKTASPLSKGRTISSNEPLPIKVPSQSMVQSPKKGVVQKMEASSTSPSSTSQSTVMKKILVHTNDSPVQSEADSSKSATKRIITPSSTSTSPMKRIKIETSTVSLKTFTPSVSKSNVITTSTILTKSVPSSSLKSSSAQSTVKTTSTISPIKTASVRIPASSKIQLTKVTQSNANGVKSSPLLKKISKASVSQG